MTEKRIEILTVQGMTCSGCQVRIEKKLRQTEGVISAKASYNKGKVSVTYDLGKITLHKIKELIQALDYRVTKTEDTKMEHTKKQDSSKINFSQLGFIAIIILGLSVMMNRVGGFAMFNAFPEAKAGMGYATLFVIGVLTSVHCIAMCGGINLTQCVPQGTKTSGSKMPSLRPSFLYNLGRVISYTVIGGMVGAIGSVVSFSGAAKGAVAIFAGVFMVIMGINMLNIFPWMRKFSLHMPGFLTSSIRGKKQSNGPFYVGLVNGLMPCGPLQAMQLYALSTGDPIKGAFSMLVFSLGTVPLMFSFGALSSLLSKKFTKHMMSVSAVLVIILGVAMLNNGMSLSGFMPVAGGASSAGSSGTANEASVVDGVQIVEIEVTLRGYEAITVKKGIPVQFNLHAEAENLSGCNRAIQIPAYGVKQKLQAGDNMVEFTPTEAGVIPYSCWMGMIRSQIVVVE